MSDNVVTMPGLPKSRPRKGVTRRRLYKPERRAARANGPAIVGMCTEADISIAECRAALWTLCKRAGLMLGRLLDYDAASDEFTVQVEVIDTREVTDAKIKGGAVTAVVRAARVQAIIAGKELEGGKLTLRKQG
jgi:hypothetical protein